MCFYWFCIYLICADKAGAKIGSLSSPDMDLPSGLTVRVWISLLGKEVREKPGPVFLLLVGTYGVWPEFLHNQLTLSSEGVLGTVPHRTNAGGSV